MTAAGYRVTVRPSDVCETPPPGLRDHGRVVEALAARKARGVPRRAGEWILAADTLVFAGDRPLGKPANRAEAAAMLRRLSGAQQEVLTGVALVDPRGRLLLGHERTVIRMRTIPEAEILAYVAGGESDGKAGAYAIQETGDRFVESLDGGLSNVVGLPMGLVRDLLRHGGFARQSVPGTGDAE